MQQRGNDHKMIDHLLKCRFSILCFVLIVLPVLQTINGQWGGDFWEHAAVVQELSTHPFSPQHPFLLLEVRHQSYSPYALRIALISRTTELDSLFNSNLGFKLSETRDGGSLGLG